jgi:hypothetical protein
LSTSREAPEALCILHKMIMSKYVTRSRRSYELFLSSEQRLRISALGLSRSFNFCLASPLTSDEIVDLHQDSKTELIVHLDPERLRGIDEQINVMEMLQLADLEQAGSTYDETLRSLHDRSSRHAAALHRLVYSHSPSCGRAFGQRCSVMRQVCSPFGQAHARAQGC